MRKGLVFLSGIGIIAGSLFFLSASQSHASVSPTEPTKNGLVGYWSFDEGTGTIAHDFSGTGNTGTLVNSPTWISGKRGSALSFNGTNNTVQVPYSSSLAPASAISFGAWFKTNNVGTLDQPILSKTEGGGYSLYLNDNRGVCGSSTTLCFALNNGSYHYAEYPASNLSSNTWYFAIATYDGAAMKLYLNGTQVASTSVSGAINYTANNAFCIGYEPGPSTCSDGSGFFNGQIDDVRVYNRALSATEVSSLYHAGEETVQTANKNGLVGYWNFDEATGTIAHDFSGNNNTATLTSSLWGTGKHGSALNVTNQNASIPGTNFNFGASQNFAIAFWLKAPTSQSDTGNTDNSIVEKWNGGAPYPFVVRLFNQTASTGLPGKITFIRFDGSNISQVVSTTAINDNKWHYIVAVKNGSTLYLYIDNVLNSSVADSTFSNPSNSSSLYLGERGSGTNHLSGTLDDIRIYNRALSATEISNLYKSGELTAQASPTARITNGLVGYWTFDGNSISGTTAKDMSGNSNNGTLTNSPTPTIGKIGQALRFNGINSIVQMSGTASLNLSTTGTVSAWFNSSDWGTGTYNVIYGYGDLGHNLGTYSLYLNGTTLMGSIGDGTSGHFISSPTYTISRNKWYHAVFTWDGSFLRLYVNGVSQGTPTAQTNNANPTSSSNSFTAPPIIGGWDVSRGPYSFNGRIEDVRVYNRALSAAEVQQLYLMGK